MLSIVPKWNWNALNSYSRERFWAYQSYQSGIETIAPSARLSLLLLSIVPKWNWNYTISSITDSGIATINRTKVELKRCADGLFLSAITSINRTKVELKLDHALYFVIKHLLSIVPKWNWNFVLYFALRVAFAINRTKVELKLGQRNWTFWKSALSIVPKWNWNWWTKVLQWILMCYQSYQSGIETNKLNKITSSGKPINRTKVELKR